MFNTELFKDSTLYYRSKAYCTDSYVSTSEYTINDSQYTESDAGDSNRQYIMV